MTTNEDIDELGLLLIPEQSHKAALLENEEKGAEPEVSP